jgi:hypothetical protein
MARSDPDLAWAAAGVEGDDSEIAFATWGLPWTDFTHIVDVRAHG